MYLRGNKMNMPAYENAFQTIRKIWQAKDATILQEDNWRDRIVESVFQRYVEDTIIEPFSIFYKKFFDYCKERDEIGFNENIFYTVSRNAFENLQINDFDALYEVYEKECIRYMYENDTEFKKFADSQSGE